jgi:hypothetical protein
MSQEQQPEKAGQEYTDAQIRLVLSHPPTMASAVLLAEPLGRAVPAIEMIYRRIYPGFTHDPSKFTRQVRRIAKEMGWLLPVGNVE